MRKKSIALVDFLCRLCVAWKDLGDNVDEMLSILRQEGT